MHPVYLEIKEPRVSNTLKTVDISLTISTIVYVTVAGFGYILFGNAVQTDMLLNFESGLGIYGSQVRKPSMCC